MKYIGFIVIIIIKKDSALKNKYPVWIIQLY